MGFWDAVAGVANALGEKQDDAMKLKEEYKRYSDDRLLRIAKGASSTFTEKMGAAAVLKDRGITS